MEDRDPWATVASEAWQTLTGESVAWTVEGGAVIAERYQLAGLLGEGGQGRVFLARDLRTGEDVAIKLQSPAGPEQQARLRRERAALRWLALPGVVPLLDDGRVGALEFLVMPRVHGTPFPGRTLPARWEAVEGAVLGLLETLGALHRAGVVHGDLKPANLLIGEDGRAVLLDFGVARGGALLDAAGQAPGLTPRYAAPELLAGAPGGPRADLWALGRMLDDALAAPLPPAVAAWITALLEPDPARRPASGDAARALLGRGAGPIQPPSLESVDSITTLQALFAGPERFLRRRSRAAAALRGWAGESREAAEAELRRWLALGLARPGEAGLEVDLAALDREAAARARVEDVAEAMTLARAALAEGRPGLAAGAAERAAALADREGSVEALREALSLVAVAALRAEDTPSVERALFTLDALGPEEGWRSALRALLLAWRATLRGEGARAAAILEELPAFAEPELEGWRVATRVAAARHRGLAAEEAVIRAASAYAEQGELARSRWLGWLGNLRYRQGLYEEAAALQQAALAGRTEPDRRVSGLLNLAMALLEGGAHARAASAAAEALQLAAALQHAGYEALAFWLERQARHRDGEPLVADEEAVRAGLALGPPMDGLIALTEAAIAWRALDHAGAARHARLAERRFRASSAAEDARGLAEALWVAASAASGAPAEPDPGWLDGRLGWGLPEIGLQALGLLAAAGRRAAPAVWEALEARLEGRVLDRARRMEVLSLEEVAWYRAGAARLPATPQEEG